MKTSELTDAALDWAVNQIEECSDDPRTPRFSTDWAQGGPIIERERISVGTYENDWCADVTAGETGFVQGLGPTPLVAAMRCYVASRLGDEVTIPDEIKMSR